MWADLPICQVCFIRHGPETCHASVAPCVYHCGQVASVWIAWTPESDLPKTPALGFCLDHAPTSKIAEAIHRGLTELARAAFPAQSDPGDECDRECCR